MRGFVDKLLTTLDALILRRYGGRKTVDREQVPPVSESEAERLRKIIGEDGGHA